MRTRPVLAVRIKRSAIFVHRWLGVALCVVFLIWFPSGIGMMYWDYPSVSGADRLQRMPALNAATVRLSPEEAYAKAAEGPPPTPIRLNSFDGRPVYRFGNEAIVYADTGEEQDDISPALMLRVAAAWTGQPASAAHVEPVDEVDQWTVGGVFRDRPLWKYSWADGEQVYVSENSGEVVQYTTTASRLGAYVGAIPHWLYFTPLRKHGRNGAGSSSGRPASARSPRCSASPSASGCIRRRSDIAIDGVPTSIPYRGQKRWHTVFGLIFGLGAVTWAFSGMLSMDPFPTPRRRAGGGRRAAGGGNIPQALRGRVEIAALPPAIRGRRCAASGPGRQGTGAHVVRRETGVPRDAGDGRDAHRARSTARREPHSTRQRMIDLVNEAAQPAGLAEIACARAVRRATTSIDAASVRCR